MSGQADTPSDLNLFVVDGEKEASGYHDIYGLPTEGNIINWYTKNGEEYEEYDFNNSLILNSVTHPVQEDPYVYYRKYIVNDPDWDLACNYESEGYGEVNIHMKENRDELYNRTETTVYGFNEDEENVEQSASKSYFDLTGQLLQSQSWIYDTDDESQKIIMASQPIYDIYNRPAIQTMSAPMTTEEFEYDPDFVRTSSGTDEAGRYSSDDFSSSGASAVDASTEGTLGWYYSANNTMEDNIAITSYPFSQTSFYKDGSGETMRSAAPGDELHMGMGKETKSKMLPIGEMSEELKIYNILRKKLIDPNLEDVTDVYKQVRPRNQKPPENQRDNTKKLSSHRY